MKRRILLVEDEPGLVMTLTDRLLKEGYDVESAGNGNSALEKSRANFDLIVLDIMLPYSSGLEVCQELRRLGVKTPVLMLTAKSQVLDKVIGLKLGADDYLTKPFEMIELLARLEALLRRSAAADPVRALGETFQFGEILVNFRTTEVFRAGQALKLSAREFKLLRYFIRNVGTTLSREELLNAVWGYEAMVFTRTVDVHVAWLRQKIEPNPRQPRYIHTVHGHGYRFVTH
jgi:two-component system, OmpR family, alkaline phosphatase synthesis response regulator PhoP